jgi:hypothetical protein
VKAKQVYLHVAGQCERAATATDLPSTGDAMLAAADVWRRLAANFYAAGSREHQIGPKETRERGLLVENSPDEERERHNAWLSVLERVQ